MLQNLSYTMKYLPARPLRALHVLTLLHTCLLVPLTASVPDTRLKMVDYNDETRAMHVNRTIAAPARAHMEFPHHETDTKMEEKKAKKIASEFRSEFLQMLRKRRTPRVPLTTEIVKPVENAWYQKNSPSSKIDEEIMKSCPKKDIENFKDLLKEENLYLNTEEGEQGKLPLLILSLKESDKQIKRPAVVFLHGTNKYKEFLRPLLEAYASRGYIAISVDSRYHGERAKSATTYRDALISAWRTGNTMPFIYDTVWDLIKLADYLTQREDIDPSRIGITGISLGGMHAWFAAAADTRYAVVAPIIGVQGFRWAIDNDKWHDRVDSIKPVFEVARHDLGKSAIDKDVVEKVWDRIAPGLASKYDSPYSVPSIAPRPLLIINGADDPRCHLAGLENVKLKTSQIYEVFQCSDNFKFMAEPEIAHQISKFQVKESSDWFDKFLKPQQLKPKL
ncbi:uncharacterized protein LOC131660027 [Vicia villosa]|uniref:uncharacterized protein LOC131660027 n=1 Tax=Vicia villosa TaxID=3911 RepID=UPI00273BF02D|nr:uncharacterized protein LOC131660027 [Vicia villosa]